MFEARRFSYTAATLLLIHQSVPGRRERSPASDSSCPIAGCDEGFRDMHAQEDTERAPRRRYFRFLLRSTMWIMLLMIPVSSVNILLNVIDPIFQAHWGYTWLSLANCLVFTALPICGRRLAAWGLRQL